MACKTLPIGGRSHGGGEPGNSGRSTPKSFFVECGVLEWFPPRSGSVQQVSDNKLRTLSKTERAGLQNKHSVAPKKGFIKEGVWGKTERR